MVFSIKEVAVWLWTKCPWFIKWPFVVIVGPNLTVNTIIFFTLMVPWVKTTLHAEIVPLREARDRQIEAIVREQSLQNAAIIQRLNDLHELNKLALAAALRNK